MAHGLLCTAYLPHSLDCRTYRLDGRPHGVGRRDEVTRYLKHARLLAGALALIVGLTLVAPPAFSATPAPGPIAAAATAKVAAAPAEALAQAAQAAPAAPATVPAETGDKPFLKTTPGVIAVALLAGGLGYMAYSWSNDRVKSPAK
jgi:hypothetical protein